MHRRPSATVQLALKHLVDEITKTSDLHLLRGNHDSETKADNGVTSLSLYKSLRCHVYVHTSRAWINGIGSVAFIPHYEDQPRILRDLENASGADTVFGHFGFYGALNSMGDNDFQFDVSHFKVPTYLGHVHRQLSSGKVMVLGTQYTTNFGEADKKNYYGVFTDGEFELKEATGGPRHMVLSVDEIDLRLKEINDPEYFTLVRVAIKSLEEIEESSLKKTLAKKLKVAHIEVKYKPIFEKGPMDDYDPEGGALTVISDDIIMEYLAAQNTDLPRDALLEGLADLRGELDA